MLVLSFLPERFLAERTLGVRGDVEPTCSKSLFATD